MNVARLVLLLFLSCAVSAFAEMRTYRLEDGTDFQGEFIKYAKNKAFFKVEGKKKAYNLSLKKLIPEDRQYVIALSRGEKPPKPFERPVAKTPEAKPDELMTEMMMEEKPDGGMFAEIYDIFENRCLECHNDEKKKGSYRMDDPRLAFEGGESGLVAIEAGYADRSELFYRITLPHDDDDVMPPEKKPKLEQDEIDLIEKWIIAGAVWDANYKPTKRPVVDDYYPPTLPHVEKIFESIRAMDGRADYTAWRDDTVMVQLGHASIKDWGEVYQMLEALGDRLVWLDLRDCEAPESFWMSLSNLKSLKRLHLQGSNVSDAVVTKFSVLPDLNYLNLCRTGIGDRGLKSLGALSSLEKLYLFESEVTSAGIKALLAMKPKLNLGGLGE